MFITIMGLLQLLIDFSVAVGWENLWTSMQLTNTKYSQKFSK